MPLTEWPATAWWARDGAAFDRAIAEFAESYAEVNEEDHRSSGEAVRFGRVLAQADCERGTRPVLRLLPDGPAGRSVERELAHAIHGTVVGAGGGDGGGQRARRHASDQVVLSVLGTLTVYWIAARCRSVGRVGRWCRPRSLRGSGRSFVGRSRRHRGACARDW